MAGLTSVDPAILCLVYIASEVECVVLCHALRRGGVWLYRETLARESPDRALSAVEAFATEEHCLAMVIHTGGDKRKGVRAEVTTGAGGKTFAQHDSKDVPRFAPNFNVYVLPPDVVCLYSDDRKFFLHGSLYCALASAIGAGRSFRDIFRGLEREFPSDKIHEAMKRLLDRRFIVPTLRTSGDTAAAYWASLGLSTEAAEKSLQKCRVRIESINVQGAKELTAALEALGVRVVKRAADLTVTLVNDYLEERLIELNRKHLSDHSRWLLVQPSGIFPLVGPIFTPGKGACWNCLADRMARNREVKALLERSDARCVATSPLARHSPIPKSCGPISPASSFR